jgi:hypothetical protein
MVSISFVEEAIERFVLALAFASTSALVDTPRLVMISLVIMHSVVAFWP